MTRSQGSLSGGDAAPGTEITGYLRRTVRSNWSARGGQDTPKPLYRDWVGESRMFRFARGLSGLGPGPADIRGVVVIAGLSKSASLRVGTRPRIECQNGSRKSQLPCQIFFAADLEQSIKRRHGPDSSPPLGPCSPRCTRLRKRRHAPATAADRNRFPPQSRRPVDQVAGLAIGSSSSCRPVSMHSADCVEPQT